MDLDDLIKNFKDRPMDLFRRKLNELVINNPSYSNLGESERKIIIGIISKYAEKLREGRGLSFENIRDETHRLYEKRLESKLTENDLEDIKKILEKFKK